MREWFARVGVKVPFIEPGSPWENGYIESFNRKLRDELLNGEILPSETASTPPAPSRAQRRRRKAAA